MNYDIVVGLEIHVELSTKSKVYCSCANEFGAEVNTNTCPVCLGMPGALPVFNEKVAEYAVRAGHALNCEINPISKFDRKNYFYPDTPKAYQITQDNQPICRNGSLDFIVNEAGDMKTIGIERIHIEEDAGKMLHDTSFDGTLIDFNRSGVPLIEIVTDPDLTSARDARLFLETLRHTLIAIGVTDGKMQEGSIRCDVNVSLKPKGSKELGTRCEMKNVNTFSGAERAIIYEVERQRKILDAGGVITQDTLRWDDQNNESTLLRGKEEASEYRYFPEPDLTTLVVSKDTIEKAKESIPELPHHKVKRFIHDYSLPLAEANQLIENPDRAAFFEQCVALESCDPIQASNWILGDISRILNEKNSKLKDTKLTAEELCEMISLISDKAISNTSGKTIIEIIMFEDKPIGEIIEEKGLSQISDTSEIETLAKTILKENPETIRQYKDGRTNVLGFLVGQGMKASKGQANPALLSETILKLIEESD